jgi:tetratricopeptide (TPR) repeat protein
MRAARIAAAFALLAGCYEPSALRREHTTIPDDAGARLAAATLAPAKGPTKEQLFTQHYDAALAFYQQARYPEAIAEFEVAYGIDAQPLLLFNIGQAYRKGGRPAEALAKYREYLDKDPSAERNKIDDLIRDVQRQIAARR